LSKHHLRLLLLDLRLVILLLLILLHVIIIIAITIPSKMLDFELPSCSIITQMLSIILNQTFLQQFFLTLDSLVFLALDILQGNNGRFV